VARQRQRQQSSGRRRDGRPTNTGGRRRTRGGGRRAGANANGDGGVVAAARRMRNRLRSSHPNGAGRSLQGHIITGDDIEDYRTVPPVSFVLSPTPARPTEADVEIVREAVRKTVLDGLRAEAGAGDGAGDDDVDVDVDVSFDLGEVVELTFVPDDSDGRGGSKLRRRNLVSSVHSAVEAQALAQAQAASRRTQDTSAYTVVGFGESKVTYRAPLLSDFTPPSQTAFEKETWVAVVDDATAKIPDAIRTAVATATGAGGGGGSVLSGLEGATSDPSYEPPSSADEAKGDQPQLEAESDPQPEPQPEVEPEPEPEPEQQPVQEEEMPEEEKVEDIPPVQPEEEDQPPAAAEEGSDGEALTVPPPAEEEEKPVVEVEEESTNEVGVEGEPTVPAQEEEEVVDTTEQPDTPLTESQPPPVVDEPQQEEEVVDNTEQPDTALAESQPPPVVDEPQQEQEQEQEDQQQGNVLPIPTPEEEEDIAADTPAKEDEQIYTVPDPQDSATPPPLFGGGEYTGEASVSSVGTAEGSDEGTISRGGTGSEGPAIGAIVGGCMAALLAVLFIAAMFVKRRRRRQSREGGGKNTKLKGDVEDQGELNAEKTFELDESGEIMQVEPADGNRSSDVGLLDRGDDEDSQVEKAGGGGYLPTGLFGSFVGGNRSANRKATPRKSPKAAATDDDADDDGEDSVLTDWSGAPSVNSLGHSVQGSVADDDPTSVANDLSKTYDLSKNRSGGANILLQFKKKKDHKRSKSMDLSGQPNTRRTEEDFERHRNVASISLRKDMMCTVDSMSTYPMHGRSRSADHGLLASGTSLGASPEAPEAGWIWGSRNEADMKPKNGGGQDLEML